MMKKLLLLLLLVTSYARGQTTVNGRVMTGTLATKPAACSPGDQFNTTDGNGAYLCNPTSNTWQPIGGTGGPAFNQTIQVASVPMTQRPILNFPSYITCVDNAGNTSTDCTPNILVGAGGGHAAGLVPDPGPTVNNNPLCDNGTFSAACKGAPGSISSPVTSPSSILWGTPANPVDMHFGGVNPNIDAVNYGARSVNANVAPAIPGITATINSGSATASISSASTFVNGDGVVIYGAGATNTMSTPGAPTVVPSVAAAETGSLMDVAAPAGGTQYCYQIVARDVNGGLTAASTETCTATGATTLGSRTNTISAITMANNVVTVTTSAAHGLAVGALVNISGVVNPSYNGWFIVATSADNTHFTYLSLSDTRGGTSTSSSSGTITYWQDNHITWTAVTGAFQYYIYGRVTGGTKTLIGTSWPQNVNVSPDTTYLAFDDFGGTLTTLPIKPSYVPTNPPAAAINDMLITTISSGAGTTTLTLATTAGNNATNQTILFDNSVNFIAAATVARTNQVPVLLPAGNFVFNAPMALPTQITVIQRGTVTINETISMNKMNWVGESEEVNRTSFASTAGIRLFIGAANPAIYITDYSNFTNLTFLNGSNANGQVTMLADSLSALPSGIFKDINFVMTGGGTDYMNMAFISRSIHTGGGGIWDFNNLLLSTSQNGNLLACTPAMFFNSNANPKFTNLFLSGKGILVRPTVSGTYLEADKVYCQGCYNPLFAFTNFNGGGIAGTFVNIKNAVLDTTFLPLVANLGGMSMQVQIEMTSGAANLVTGVPNTVVFAADSQPFTQSTGLETVAANANVADGVFGFNQGGFAVRGLNASEALGTGYSLFSQDVTPAAPTCPVSAGGSVPQPSTFFYYYVPVYANGSEGKFSGACSATTSSGNQTVSVAWAKVAGAVGYDLYRGPSANNVILLSCSLPATTTNSYTDTAGSACGNSPPSTPSGGPAGMQNGTVWANILALGPSTAPTGVVNQTKLYMDSTLNWPSFKANNNTAYQVLGVTGSVTAGHVGCFSGSVTGAMTDCPGGGGGSTNAALQGSIPWYSAAGTTSTLSGINGPTTPNTFWFFGSTPTGGAAGVPAFSQAGISGRSTASSSFSILDVDRATRVLSTNGAANAVTLPGAGTTGFLNNYVFRYKATGASNVSTITPGAGTINSSGTLVVNQGTDCLISSTDNTNYVADCHDPPIIAGTNITIVRGDNGITLSSTAGGGNMQTASPNTMGAAGTLDGSAMATTAGMKVPVGAGAVPTADGAIANNSTNHTLVTGANGVTDVVAVAATGTNTATTCTNQFVSAISGVAVPTCSTVANAALANASTTPNGQTCTLGSTCNVNVGATAHGVAINEGNGSAIAGTAVGATNAILAGVSAADPGFKSLADLSASDYVAGAGSVNVMTATLAPALTANTTGATVKVLPNLANTTTTPTLAVNGLTAATITKCGTTALAVGDYNTTTIAYFTFDGTRWQLLNPMAVPCSGGGTATSTIANGTSAMGTSSISSGACATVVTTSATGTATTDVIIYTPSTDPTAPITGYGPSANGSLYIWAYPTTNNVNFRVCNNTANSITPGALTLNWRIVR